MKRAFLVLLLLVIGPPAHAQKKPAIEIRLERYTLPNGLEVMLHRDAKIPMVTVNLWYHVGAANERAGRSGFAHLFEHMMFQGSRHVGDDQHFAILESIGGRGMNASTSFDRTNYYQTAPKNELETLLWLESDRMGFLLDTLTLAKLDNQRDVVRNERRQRTDNRPYGKADERYIQLLFPDPHPYHGVVIGSHEDLQAATVDDVKGFFRTYYVPNNATLVVAGDFDPAEAKKLIETYFGTFEKEDEPPPLAAKVQEPPAKEVREALTDDVQLPRITVGWIGPVAFGPGDADMDVAMGVLGSGKSSRLYKELVYDKKIAQAATCTSYGLRLGGLLSCTVMAKPNVSLEELEKALEVELAAMRDKGPTKEEVDRVKTAIRAGRIRGLQSAAGRADLVQRYNHYLGDPDSLAKDFARYDAVTPATVKKQTQTWLDPARRVVVTVTPRGR